MNTSFYLNNTRKNSKATKPQSIVLYISYSPGYNQAKKNIRITLPIKIAPKHWDFKKQTSRNAEINQTLESYRLKVQQTYETSNGNFENIVHQCIYPDTDPEITFWQALEDYMNQMKRRVKPDTYRVKYYTKSFLHEFSPTTTWHSLNYAYYEKFYHFLCNKGLSSGYIQSITATLKSFAEWAYNYKYHENRDHKRYKFPANKVTEKISLNEKDISKLMLVSLPELLEPIRDLFLFQLFTGQRISDVLNFHRDQVTGDEWKLIQQKTNKQVVIHMVGFSAPALRILMKYDYKLPVFSIVWIDKQIKEIAKLAGVDEPVTIVKYPGGKPMKVTRKKYELISTHTARRTFATTLLSHGVPIPTVMDMTGHTDWATLKKYYKPNLAFSRRALEEVGELRVMGVG